MPVISMFYGLIIRMYYFDHQKHKSPHIHVQYGEQQVVIGIPDGIILEGVLKTQKLKLVHAWMTIRQKVLNCGAGFQPASIYSAGKMPAPQYMTLQNV